MRCNIVFQSGLAQCLDCEAIFSTRSINNQQYCTKDWKHEEPLLDTRQLALNNKANNEDEDVLYVYNEDLKGWEIHEE